jgi:hypothetical protein
MRRNFAMPLTVLSGACADAAFGPRRCPERQSKPIDAGTEKLFFLAVFSMKSEA